MPLASSSSGSTARRPTQTSTKEQFRPLAGRPPFASDRDDAIFDLPAAQPRSQPSKRTAARNANDRTSAYDTYDEYFKETSQPNDRDSGAAFGVGMGLMGEFSDDDSESDEDDGILARARKSSLPPTPPVSKSSPQPPTKSSPPPPAKQSTAKPSPPSKQLLAPEFGGSGGGGSSSRSTPPSTMGKNRALLEATTGKGNSSTSNTPSSRSPRPQQPPLKPSSERNDESQSQRSKSSGNRAAPRSSGESARRDDRRGPTSDNSNNNSNSRSDRERRGGPAQPPGLRLPVTNSVNAEKRLPELVRSPDAEGSMVKSETASLASRSRIPPMDSSSNNKMPPPATAMSVKRDDSRSPMPAPRAQVARPPPAFITSPSSPAPSSPGVGAYPPKSTNSVRRPQQQEVVASSPTIAPSPSSAGGTAFSPSSPFATPMSENSPITPLFAAPQLSEKGTNAYKVSFGGGSGGVTDSLLPIMRGDKESYLLDRTPKAQRDIEKKASLNSSSSSGESTLVGHRKPRVNRDADDFWRRFSMVAHQDLGGRGSKISSKSSLPGTRGLPQQQPGGSQLRPTPGRANLGEDQVSSWLYQAKARARSSSRRVYLLTFVLLLCVAGGVTAGIKLGHQTPDHADPVAIGGGGNNQAGPTGTTSEAAAGPTSFTGFNIITRRTDAGESPTATLSTVTATASVSDAGLIAVRMAEPTGMAEQMKRQNESPAAAINKRVHRDHREKMVVRRRTL